VRLVKKFFDALATKRKVALRMGELLESSAGYTLKQETLKKLCRKTITIDDLTEDDFIQKTAACYLGGGFDKKRKWEVE
jgi:hypothetical protein